MWNHLTIRFLKHLSCVMGLAFLVEYLLSDNAWCAVISFALGYYIHSYVELTQDDHG